MFRGEDVWIERWGLVSMMVLVGFFGVEVYSIYFVWGIRIGIMGDI